MIYSPSETPGEVFSLITALVIAGIVGGYFAHIYFPLLVLLFWIQYTMVLSFFQFKKKHKYGYSSFTEILLHPQIRFFLYEFKAITGIILLFLYGMNYVVAGILVAWWLFSLNFYIYYKKKSK